MRPLTLKDCGGGRRTAIENQTISLVIGHELAWSPYGPGARVLTPLNPLRYATGCDQLKQLQQII